MKLILRSLIVILVSALVIIIMTWFFLRQSTSPPLLNTVPVRIGDIESTVLATGRLDAFERVDVGAQVSGQVNFLEVKVGDRVTKGQLIADIDDLPQRNNLLNSEAEFDVLKADAIVKEAQLKQAEIKFKRQRNLLKENAGSLEAFESAETALVIAKADILSLKSRMVQAQIDLDRKKLELSYTRVTAPMDGVIIAVITQQGQTVNSQQSAPTIVKIAKLDVMTIRAQISEADITKVHPGQKAWFTVFAEPDNRYEATLRVVEPAPDSIVKGEENNNNNNNNPVYYSALLDVDNSENRLRIAMLAQVSLQSAEANNVLLIPIQAVKYTEGNLQEVQVLNTQGLPETRKITTGIQNDTDIQILSGLKEGEEVVIPELQIPDGGVLAP